MLKNTGYEEISLSSLSSSDYSHLKELVTFLIDEFGSKDINISLPSLRIDAFSLDVMGKVQDVRKSSLTFAPEDVYKRQRLTEPKINPNWVQMQSWLYPSQQQEQQLSLLIFRCIVSLAVYPATVFLFR